MSPKKFSVILGCYGNHANISLRAANSVCKLGDRKNFDFHVGLNQCCEATRKGMEIYYEMGEIDTVITSRPNINKDPMMRLLIELCQTEYVLWMDDDSHFIESGWDLDLLDYIEENDNKIDVAGHVYFFHTNGSYHKFLKQRPWYTNKPRKDNRIFFATGGLFLARTEFLKYHNFPDREMIKKQDDVLLGDLCYEQNGNLRDWTGHKLFKKMKISDADRRGKGERSFTKNV